MQTRRFPGAKISLHSSNSRPIWSENECVISHPKQTLSRHKTLRTPPSTFWFHNLEKLVTRWQASEPWCFNVLEKEYGWLSLKSPKSAGSFLIMVELTYQSGDGPQENIGWCWQQGSPVRYRELLRNLRLRHWLERGIQLSIHDCWCSHGIWTRPQNLEKALLLVSEAAPDYLSDLWSLLSYPSSCHWQWPFWIPQQESQQGGWSSLRKLVLAKEKWVWEAHWVG